VAYAVLSAVFALAAASCAIAASFCAADASAATLALIRPRSCDACDMSTPDHQTGLPVVFCP
jgi:hypothetical protein